MTGREQETEVIVVGAGVSGLAAVSALCAADVPVICLEARDRVGGRILSVGGWVDLGATWFWDNEPAMADTIASLGLATYPQAIDGDALFERPDGGTVRLAGNPIDVPAWRLTGGMQTLALELARRLPDGVVQTGAPVAALTFGADGRVHVTTNNRSLTGRMVVLAIPPRLAATSIEFSPPLPSDLARVAASVHTWMSDMIKAVARFDEPFWYRSGLAGAAFSHAGPFREFHDHSGPEPSQAAIFGFAPAAQLNDAPERVIAEQFTTQLTRLWGPPARHPSAVHIVDWSRERFTATQAPTTLPASSPYGNPVLHIPHMHGRLAFASTETAADFAGHLEGALLAGRRAADQALNLLARHTAPRPRVSGGLRVAGEK
ncbi:MAG: flavin monoamine oxidase family protein [Trebonia sp.]